MPYSKRDAPNCDWCPYKKNCFYELLGNKDAKKAWREMRLANPFKRGEVIFHEGAMPQGVWWHGEGGKAETSGKHSLATDLSTLPYIDRDLTRWRSYGEAYLLPSIAYILTGRGCGLENQ